MSTKVLIADDDRLSLAVLSQICERNGYEPIVASCGKEAVDLASDEIELALIDLMMPEMDGHQVLRYLKQHYPQIRVIVLSGAGKATDIVSVLKSGAFWYLSKPVNPAELLGILEKAEVNLNLDKTSKGLMSAMGSAALTTEFITGSETSKELLEQIRLVSRMDSTILITGESGTGKSTIARLIHQMSDRTTGPFITVNCASLPPDLLEAELFGHERGAFTGAVSARPGRLEIADGGTVFLDEIGELPLHLQPKLLGFLENKMVQRIGSNTAKEVDVRIVAATLQDLDNMCRDKRFRRDLYFRLAVVSLNAPPLRERTEDIPTIIDSFLKQLGQKTEHDLRITSEALLRLQKHTWPGNIRELENTVERAAVFSESGRLNIIDIDEAIDQQEVNAPIPPDATFSLAGLTLEEIERLALVETLKHTEGNKSAAARILNISEKSVYNKLKRLGIASADFN